MSSKYIVRSVYFLVIKQGIKALKRQTIYIARHDKGEQCEPAVVFDLTGQSTKGKLRRGRWARKQLSIPLGILRFCLQGTPGEPGYLSRGGPSKKREKEKYETSAWPNSSNCFQIFLLNIYRRVWGRDSQTGTRDKYCTSSTLVCEISSTLLLDLIISIAYVCEEEPCSIVG